MTATTPSPSSSPRRDDANERSPPPIKQLPSRKQATARGEAKVADSWEDEESASDSDEAEPSSGRADDNGGSGARAVLAPASAAPPAASSPSTWAPSARDEGGPGSGLAAGGSERPRQEKTDAVARRMIAGALGLKVPKQTEERKAYETAIRDGERQRRERERVAEQQRKEEAERARAAMWND